MVNNKKPLWKVPNERKMNIQTYTVIAVDGDDAVYMFSGSGDILLDLIPGLTNNIKEHIPNVLKLH